MADFLGIELVPASILRQATFLEAAEALTTHPVSAVAVLDEVDRVVGVFSAEGLLRGLFPRYLGELRHTAFARDDATLLERIVREGSDEPVERHMQRPVTLEYNASATHAAEVFLHCELDALPVVREGRFLGMLGISAFCRAMLGVARRRPAPP